MDKYPHAPLHWFKREGQYIITAGTYLKKMLFAADDDLDFLQSSMFEVAAKTSAELHSGPSFQIITTSSSTHHHILLDFAT